MVMVLVLLVMMGVSLVMVVEEETKLCTNVQDITEGTE